MEWSDGARFQGYWSYSKPYGHGIFTFIDGDAYEGEWKIPYVSTENSFGKGENLNKLKETVNDGYCNL